jgi:magnesium transporter
MMIVDNAIYVDGHRASEPHSLRETYEALRKERGVAWIGLYRPTEEEFASVAEEFELHELAVEDALEAHQRPKLERYGQTLFIVLRPARYLDDPEEVEFGEIHVFVGEDFVITVRHGEAPALGEVRRRLEADPELLVRGPEAILYAIMDRVVDGYAPVVRGLENDIDEIEVEVFSGNPGVSRRTYELSREVIEFQRAVKPLSGMLANLIAGFEKYEVDPELQRYLRDVQDHAIEVNERLQGSPPEHPERQPHAGGVAAKRGGQGPLGGEYPAERRGEEDQRLGGDPVRPYAGWHRLWDELRPHAGAALAVRLPVRPNTDAASLHLALPGLQAARLALTRRTALAPSRPRASRHWSSPSGRRST